MNPYVLLPLLGAILNFVIVAWVFAQAAPGLVRRTFIFWNVWQGLWNAGIALGYVMPDAPSAALWYVYVSSIVVRFIAPLFLHFVAAITETSQRTRTTYFIRAAYLSGFFFAITGIKTTWWMDGAHLFYWGYYPLAGRYEWVFGVSFFTIVGYALSLLVAALRQRVGYRRNQIQYLLIGSAIFFGGGITNFLALYRISIYPIGSMTNSLYSLFVAYAIVEYKLLDIQVVLRRGMVYGFLAGGLTFIYLSLVAVLQRIFGHYGFQESVTFYTAAFPLTVILAPTMKTRIEPFIDRTFFGRMPSSSDSALKNHDMALMGVLATEMAHELAKPLTHIMNEGSRLGNNAKGTSKEGLSRIEKAAQRAAEILDGFALLSPDRPLHQISIPLEDLLQETLTALGIEADPTISVVRHYGQYPPIFVNPGQIVQVLTNVIQNAWHAMRKGGVLTLSLKTPPPNDQAIIDIVIEDTGPGIAPELLQNVFEPFFTTKRTQGGRGVGLTISRAMIERHGGRIHIESPISSQGGTRVMIGLPSGKKEITDVL